MLKEVEGAARTLGLQLQPLGTRAPAELASAFSAMMRERAGALIVLPDPMLHGQKRQIVGFAVKSRVPAIYYAKDYAGAGGLMSYGASFPTCSGAPRSTSTRS